MITTEVVCYKYKPLKNGELPLKIRICNDRKVRYVNLGVSTKIEEWDFSKNRPKATCPKKDEIEKLITSTISAIRGRIVELKASNQDFTLRSLIDSLTTSTSTKTVNEIFVAQMQRLVAEGRRNYMLSLKQVYNSLLMFNKHLDICFSDINLPFLRRYETWLRKQGKAENTIGIHFRTLRMIYNIAIWKSQLHLPLCAIKSVLLKFEYDDNHPFFQYLENTELYFNENEGRGNYGIGINTAKELVYEIIDYIIIELQAFYENE